MVLIAACLISLLPWAVGLQGSGQQPVIRISSNLVLFPLGVADSSGNIVSNLLETDFQIEENDRTEQVQSACPEFSPISFLALLISPFAPE